MIDFRSVRLSWLFGVLFIALLFSSTPQTAVAQSPGGSFAGAYKAWITSPEGRPIDSTLFLSTDGGVLWIDDSLLGDTPVTRTGQWSPSGNGVMLTINSDSSGVLPQPLMVTLDASAGQPLVMQFDAATPELSRRRYYSLAYLFENRNALPYSAEVAASTIAGSGLSGVYKAFTPGGSSGRLDLSLILLPDSRAILKRDALDGSTASLSYGAWQDIGGQAFVTLTEADGVVFPSPVEITFGVDNGVLRGLTTASASATDLIGTPFYRIEGLANAVTVLLPPDVSAPGTEAGGVPAPGAVAPEITPSPAPVPGAVEATPEATSPSTEIVAVYEPTFAETGCPTELQVGEGITCGYLTVPENRSRSDSQSIQLFVVRMAALGRAQPDPLVVLAGAPGDDPSSVVQWFATAPVRATREVLILHPRGGGLSEPSLACPEHTASDDSQAMMQALADCYNRLLQEGRDLAGYNLDQRAIDVADLARTAGAIQINLLGHDVGAAVSQLVTERYPELVRTVVLESPAPVGVNRTLEGAFGAFDALRKVFAECAQDAACAKAYPDLEKRFLEIVEWYNLHPTPGTIGFGSGDDMATLILTRLQQGGYRVPALIDALYTGNFGVACQLAPVAGGCLLPGIGASSPGAPLRVPADGQASADAVQSWRDYFENPDTPQGAEATTLERLQVGLGFGSRAELLSFLDALPVQNFLPLLVATTETTAPLPADVPTNDGVLYTILCAEDAPRFTSDDVQRVAARLPATIAPLLTASAEELLRVCALWMTPPAAAGDRVVQLNAAPALIMAGEYDPVTPAQWARRSAADFRQPVVRIFAGEGRNLLASASGCAQQMLAAFVQRPDRAPNLFCFRSLQSAFLLPETDAANTSDLVGRSQSE